MSEKENGARAEQDDAAAEKTTPSGPQETKKPKPYVFKILPADPKNSLEFEDMADK